MADAAGAAESTGGHVVRGVAGIGEFLGSHQLIVLIGGGVAVGAALLLKARGGSSAATMATPAGYVPGPVDSGSSGTAQAPDVGSLISEVTSAQSQTFATAQQAAQNQMAQSVQLVQQQQAQDAAQSLNTFNAFGQELATERNSFDQLMGTSVTAQTMQQQQNQQQLNSEAGTIGALQGQNQEFLNNEASNQGGLLSGWASSISSLLGKLQAPPAVVAAARSAPSGYSGAPGEQYNTVPVGAPPTFANQSPQIQSEFMSAFGANAQSEWNSEHAAQVAKYGS